MAHILVNNDIPSGRMLIYLRSIIGWSRKPEAFRFIPALNRGLTAEAGKPGQPSLAGKAPAGKGPPSTIRTIVVIIGILIVAMWAAVGFSLVISRQAALDDTSLAGRNLTAAFRGEIAFILRGLEGEMNLIAEKMQREGASFDLYAWGQQNVMVAPGLANATILGPDGKVRSTTREPDPPATDISDRNHFRIHLDGKFHGLFIGQTVIGRADIIFGLPLMPVSRRVETEDGTFLGVVTMLIPPSALTTLHKSIDLGPHGVMTLSGLDHLIRVRFSADSPGGTKDIGGSIAGAPRPAVIEENGLGQYIKTAKTDGITRMYSYGRIGSYPLVVSVGLDLEHGLAQWRSYATMIAGLALGATLLLIGLAAYLIRQIFRDATRARATTLQITHSAEHDFLTGLPNRMLLNDRLDQAVASAQRHGNKLAVLFLDLDGFKHINDSLGHPIGDKLLQSVAKRLVACGRGSDTVSRPAGR